MTARRYDGSSWQDLSHFRRWSGSAWTDATFARRWDGSQWVEFWPTYTNISASLSPTLYNNTASNSTGPVDVGFTCSVTGGDGGHTFTWSVTNLIGAGWSIVSGQGTSSVTVRCINGSNTQFTGTLSCVVSDGTSSDTPSASLSLTYGTPE